MSILSLNELQGELNNISKTIYYSIVGSSDKQVFTFLKKILNVHKCRHTYNSYNFSSWWYQ